MEKRNVTAIEIGKGQEIAIEELLMTPRSLEIVEGKLSVVTRLIGYAADDDLTSLSSLELSGLCEILNEVRVLMQPNTGGNTP
jgi:hypothetical protein